jgi:hypothetical protein
MCFCSCNRSSSYNRADFNSPEVENLYSACNLNEKVDYDIFAYAIIGIKNIKSHINRDVITLIDYRKASTEERFFVIDLKNKKILYSSLVAHGKGTGGNYAKTFSNKTGSKSSSLGFFITEETYKGKHGYSLKIKGIERNINNNARKRAIVIHGAEYVSNEFINSYGRLGRSWGCPALPLDKSDEIINTIKNGSCIFILGKDSSYIRKSNFFTYIIYGPLTCPVFNK